MVAVKEAGKLLPEAFNPATDEWPADAEAINENMENKLKDCDKLAGGFRKFVENAHAAVMAGAKR
jgi:hypothetical protein